MGKYRLLKRRKVSNGCRIYVKYEKTLFKIVGIDNFETLNILNNFTDHDRRSLQMKLRQQ